MTDDLYSVLGVLPEAEDIVVTAAYRALAQRYHPDRWRGSPEEAHQRMSAINEAYATLKDPTRRAEYDQTRERQGADFDSEDREEVSRAFGDALEELEKRWQVATDVFADLAELRRRLTRISTPLAFSFVTILLESRAFDRRQLISDRLETAFLQRYFGTNEQVLAYARGVVLSGNREAARKLNRLVDVIGSQVEPGLLISKIEQEFGLRAAREAAERKATQEGELRALARTVHQMGYYDDATAESLRESVALAKAAIVAAEREEEEERLRAGGSSSCTVAGLSMQDRILALREAIGLGPRGDPFYFDSST